MNDNINMRLVMKKYVNEREWQICIFCFRWPVVDLNTSLHILVTQFQVSILANKGNGLHVSCFRAVASHVFSEITFINY